MLKICILVDMSTNRSEWIPGYHCPAGGSERSLHGEFQGMSSRGRAKEARAAGEYQSLKKEVIYWPVQAYFNILTTDVDIPVCIDSSALLLPIWNIYHTGWDLEKKHFQKTLVICIKNIDSDQIWSLRSSHENTMGQVGGEGKMSSGITIIDHGI